MNDTRQRNGSDARLSHFDSAGQAHMVDISAKGESHRVAVAQGTISMRPETLSMVETGAAKKGDVLGIARIAAIMAAKRTHEFIPLCHPLALTRIAVDFAVDPEACSIRCDAQVECLGRTGVEMEALAAVQVGLLTIYDMCKSADRNMIMSNIRITEKRGGKSGDWTAQ